MTLPVANRGALTFLELLIVLAIIGVLAGVAIPQLRNTLDNFEVEGFTKDIYYLMRYIQATAISRQKIYCLNISPDNRQFWVTVKGEVDFIPLAGRYGRKYNCPEGVNITLEPADKTTVFFYPDGSIDKLAITLSSKKMRKISIISQGSAGALKIQ